MDKNNTEVVLNEEQREAVVTVKSWADDSAAALGFAYLEFREAEGRFIEAKKNLESRVVTARDSDLQRNMVMAEISKSHDLSPGEWIYDGEAKLIKKGN